MIVGANITYPQLVFHTSCMLVDLLIESMKSTIFITFGLLDC